MTDPNTAPTTAGAALRWPFAAIPPAARDTLVLALLAVSAVLSLVLTPERQLTPTTAVLALLPLVPLPWRRIAPVRVFAAVEVLALGTRLAFGPNGPADLILLVALYAVATRRPPIWAVAAVIADVAVMWTTLVVDGQLPPDQIRNELLGQVAIGLVVALFGAYVAARRAHLQALEERADRLARANALEARLAVDEERQRIARELHDVVAHHVSVMILHAGALERRLATTRGDADLVRAAASVRTTGQEAMHELRRMLGVLHREPLDGPTSPQPTLLDLGALVERMRQVGMPIELTSTGPLDDVSPGVALTVHRIAQEALTNTLRHAGLVRTEVRVDVTSDLVRLEVRDHGVSTVPRRYPTPGESGGHGLAGMRERAALYAGRVSAGSDPDGGFVVRARLPRQQERMPLE